MKTKFLVLPFVLMLGLFFVACKNERSGGDLAETSKAGNVAGSEDATETFTIVPAESVISWEGYKPGRTHEGTVQVTDGTLNATDGTLTSGSFTIDMTTITVEDLEPGKGKENLEAHLKGTEREKATDFFHTTQFPEAQFALTKVVNLESDPDASHMIYGNLTIKDITKQVAFKANVEMNDNQVMAESLPFKIDRTDWDIKFMSKSFFDDLKDNFVEDEIGLQISIAAAKNAEI